MNESAKLFERACKVIPGGVNSPVRSFASVGGTPRYVISGNGSKIKTVDGDDLIDFCGSWGPLLLGHAHPAVVEAVVDTSALGMSFGTNTPREVEFAEMICEMIPYIDMIRLVSSGTEAVMTAIRLARGFTGRDKIIKFDGGYHGHSDALLASAGSGLLTGGISASAGVPNAVTADTFIAPYNNLKSVESIISEQGENIAAIIVEPIAGNMGLVPPLPGFLEGLRRLTTKAGILLIFDEVITGFRLGPTTFGNICGVTPDITTLGKIIGGGMPIGALGSSKEIMLSLAPVGDVYQAGTLSGNPVAVAAGIANLNTIASENPYPRMEKLAKKLADGINSIAKEHSIDMHVKQWGGMFTPFFTSSPVQNLDDAKKCDTKAHALFFHEMLNHGIYLPPSQFEVGFVSAAHKESDITAILKASSDSITAMISK